MQANGMRCCGVNELAGLSGHRSPESALKALLYPYLAYPNNPRTAVIPHVAHLIFTGVLGGKRKWETSYGGTFATYIKDKGLGTVVESEVATNPNSHNRLKIWVWTLDRKALTAWAQAVAAEEEKAKELKKEQKEKEKA